MIAATLTITLLMAFSAAALVLARTRYSPATATVTDEINRLLPQTQCAQCGFPGCRPYAEAIAEGEAINRCPPGGDSTIEALAELLGRTVLPLDSDCGAEPPQVAVIREPECIGCTLCIQACPVDAIIGAPQLMHTVISETCTGCELCLPPCPVDCIDLIADETADVGINSFPAFETACINCGDCSAACPRDLQPQLLHWYRDDVDEGESLNLSACIECRRCDSVCPSEIPLTPTFREMKRRQRARDDARRQAAASQARFERREARLIATTGKVVGRPSSDERNQLLDAVRSKAGS